MTLVNGYFGEQTGTVLADSNETKIKITETETLQEAAQDLGLLTANIGKIDQDHWLSQLMSEAYRGLLSPEEMAGYLRSLSPEGRLILTAHDLSPESTFWQSLLNGQAGDSAEAKADVQNPKPKKIEDPVGRWAQNQKVLRLLLQEKLEVKKKQIMMKARGEYQASGDQALIVHAQEEIDQLEANFYGLRKADKLNTRAQSFLTNLSMLYQQLPSQEPEIQLAWLNLIKGEGDMGKTLAGLLSALKVDDIDRELTSLTASVLEKFTAKGIKLGRTVGIFALIFILMQLYTGAMGGEGSGGQ